MPSLIVIIVTIAIAVLLWYVYMNTTAPPTTLPPSTQSLPPPSAQSPTNPIIKPRQTNITDRGYQDRTHGWYDMQKQGVNNDYCRYVGDNPNTWFSCALAGASNQYTNPPSQGGPVFNPDLSHVDV